ncbi:glycerophosphodiester phosphodiesterase family protein [Kaistia dalseonensis]|uniref:Glycerophosphoryl diester phosphodiesterase n=1 Tax=Kaistia dalseonensis TaxID=410840 RepID=A0ABU0H3E1_9HYPH|nr:glycerophosphodiester phosphodiesterase family protein [Kaistia dalseonensis]MCX5494242.1 glycerophosphodiester phosphodiesterase family protein [Kaistia dalseonensis]MDQ0436822.1 glycerophosphoryl diester phosphodiesterase [Kaistia dalseonensis]
MALSWLTQRPIAHRGYHDAASGRIENTLSAVRAAIEHRFAIEVDLQLTRDGTVVVFHDETVDRLMQASGRVDSFTLAELKAIPFKAGADRVPTLAELFATVAGKVPLVLELKSEFKGDRRLEKAVAPILANYGGPAVVMSFDPESMAMMKKLLPVVPRGIVADRYTDLNDWGFLTARQRLSFRHLLSVPRVGASFVSYDLNGLPSLAPSLVRLFGLTLICWTVRTREQWEKAKRYTDQITFEGFDPDA